MNTNKRRWWLLAISAVFLLIAVVAFQLRSGIQVTVENTGLSPLMSVVLHVTGVLGFILACGLAGGFLGLLLDGSLLVFAMSYAYSPFATSEAVSSVKVVEERAPGSATHRRIVQFKHPVTLYLCLTPAVLGVVAGAVGGGVVALKYGGSKSSA